MRKNLYRLYLLGLLALVCCGKSHADPAVELTALPLRSGKQLLIQIHQLDIAAFSSSCHYNLFAAASPNALSTLPGKGTSIATFGGESEDLEIAATHLKRLSRKAIGKRKATVYLKMLMPCDSGGSYEGEIVEVAFPTSKLGRVKSVSRLVKRMKYHMRWAADVPNLAR